MIDERYLTKNIPDDLERYNKNVFIEFDKNKFYMYAHCHACGQFRIVYSFCCDCFYCEKVKDLIVYHVLCGLCEDEARDGTPYIVKDSKLYALLKKRGRRKQIIVPNRNYFKTPDDLKRYLNV